MVGGPGIRDLYLKFFGCLRAGRIIDIFLDYVFTRLVAVNIGTGMNLPEIFSELDERKPEGPSRPVEFEEWYKTVQSDFSDYPDLLARIAFNAGRYARILKEPFRPTADRG